MTNHPFIQTQDMQDSFENTQWVKAKTNAKKCNYTSSQP